METTGEVPIYGADTAYRIVCHFLLSLIPGGGLAEVYDAIRDVYNYHVTTGPRVNASLELPVRGVISARVSRSYERPGFGIAEE